MSGAFAQPFPQVLYLGFRPMEKVCLPRKLSRQLRRLNISDGYSRMGRFLSFVSATRSLPINVLVADLRDVIKYCKVTIFFLFSIFWTIKNLHLFLISKRIIAVYIIPYYVQFHFNLPFSCSAAETFQSYRFTSVIFST